MAGGEGGESSRGGFPCLDPITQLLGAEGVCAQHAAVPAGVSPDTVPSWPGGERVWASCYHVQSLFLNCWLQFKAISSMC